MASKRCHSEVSDCDEELLNSGRFSDITVKCGARTWKLHCAILTTRSSFFRNALKPGHFKESADGYVEIHEQNATQVNWVIHFIYTREAPRDLLGLLKDTSTGINTCIDLFTVADFFMMDSLCERAAEALTHLIVKHAKSARKCLNGKTSTDDLEAYIGQPDNTFLSDFFSAAKRVYSVNSESFGPLKTALILYLKLTDYAILLVESFHKRLFADSEQTSFAADILKTMTDPHTNLLLLGRDFKDRGVKLLRYRYPTKCDECKSTDDFVWTLREKDGVPKNHCTDCQPLGGEGIMFLLGCWKPEEAKRLRTN